MKTLNGILALVLANTIFGLGVPVTKLLLGEWVSPMGYMASRSVGAALLFWIIQSFVPKEKVDRRDLLLIMGAGLLGFVVSQTLTAYAIFYTSPVYVAFIAALTPIAVMVMAALCISEKITSRSLLAVALAIAGALIMVFQDGVIESGGNDILGISLAILAVLTWAVYVIVTRKVSQRYSPVTQMKWVFLISAAVTLPWASADPAPNPLYSDITNYSLLITHCHVWCLGAAEMLFIVVFATVLGFFLIPYAMRSISATAVSVFTNLQPIIATAVAVMLSQDTLTWAKVLAGALIIASAILVSITPSKT